MRQKVKTVALAVAVLVLAVSTVIFSDKRTGVAGNHGMNPLLAKVVNADDEPVPVTLQGTGDIAGDVNAVQQGEWSVQQDGDWTVGIDPSSNLVHVAQLDDASKQVFQAMFSPSWASGERTTTTNFSVPAGKRLVIERFSAHANLPPGQGVDFLTIRTPPTGHQPGGAFIHVHHHLPMKDNRVIGHEFTRIYLEPGTTVDIIAIRSGSGSTGQVFVSLVGYFVDVEN